MCTAIKIFEFTEGIEIRAMKWQNNTSGKITGGGVFFTNYKKVFLSGKYVIIVKKSY